jgi:hypothetical protein
MVDLLIPRLGAFALVFVLSLVGCPLIVILFGRFLPRLVDIFLFFWPQLALISYGFTHPASDMTQTYLDGGWNYLIMGSFWLLIGLATSWILRNKPIRFTAIAALPIVFAIGYALEPALNLFDVGVYFEGP